MERHVLGPLRVHEGGDPLPIGGPKQQAMLGVLVAHAGTVVSTDRLIDELWGDAPPETARKSVQVYTARLRRVLGADRLRGVAPGYVLDLAGVDWSFELLHPPAQLLLQRLSVFNDPFTMRAVTAVCADRRLRRAAIAEAFEDLVNASLVQVTPRAEPSFHLLDVVRDYAAILLGDRDKALRRRYVKYAGVKRDEDFRAFLQRRIHETQTYLEMHGSRWQPPPLAADVAAPVATLSVSSRPCGGRSPAAGSGWCPRRAG